jgi:AraC-like DNA-binding protein
LINTENINEIAYSLGLNTTYFNKLFKTKDGNTNMKPKLKSLLLTAKGSLGLQSQR